MQEDNSMLDNNKSELMAIRVTPSMRRALQQAATSELRNESDMIRIILHEGLDQRGLLPSQQDSTKGVS